MKHLMRLVAASLVFVPAVIGAQAPSAIEQEVLKLDRAFNDVTKPDRASLEKWLASDYLYVHSNGSVLDRAGEIRDTMSTTWTGVKLDDLKARSYGDVVIITGAITLTGTSKGYVTGARRFTDIWVKRNGQWQIVGGQSTLVPAK